MLVKCLRNSRQFRQSFKLCTNLQVVEKPLSGWVSKFLGFGILSAAVGIGFYQLTKKPAEIKNDVKLPDSEKLLPDWPYPDQDIPPGMPPLPLLVLDLERTLIGSDYDSDNGWRHVKRPGLEKFIKSLAYQYYEIVIFSENELMMIPEELFTAIDPNNLCHKFGASKAEIRDNVVLKRLDLMNRDMRKIILIDDNPESFKLCDRNTLKVKPFFSSDADSDTILLDLIPFLQALVHEGSNDFRDTFDDLGTHDAEEAVIEYRMRLNKKKQEETQKRNKGLGALLRGKTVSTENEDLPRSKILSSIEIAGNVSSAPVKGESSQVKPYLNQSLEKKPQVKKKGQLLEWFENGEEQKAKKMEKMNEIHMKRQQEKLKKEEEEKLKKMQQLED